MVEERSRHVGLLVAALLVGYHLVFKPGLVKAPLVLGCVAFGVMAYATAYLILSYLETIEYEPEGSNWDEAIEDVVMRDGERLVSGGKVVAIPAALRTPIRKIVQLRREGQLEKISLREIGNNGIASRDSQQAKDLMDWLIANGFVNQQPNLPGEWVGEDMTLSYSRPTPNSQPLIS